MIAGLRLERAVDRRRWSITEVGRIKIVLAGDANEREEGIVVKWTMPAVWSIAVVCKVAISCCPSVLRTMSSPLESGA